MSSPCYISNKSVNISPNNTQKGLLKNSKMEFLDPYGREISTKQKVGKIIFFHPLVQSEGLTEWWGCNNSLFCQQYTQDGHDNDFAASRDNQDGQKNC